MRRDLLLGSERSVTMASRGRKQPTSIRLSPEALRLLRALAVKLGISQASVMEMALRRLAVHEEVDSDETRRTVRGGSQSDP